MQTKLIILRGPSSSGKTTVMNELKSRSPRRVATVEADIFKHKILHSQDGSKELTAKLCSDVIRRLLVSGYDVVAEGLFSAKYYKNVFDDIESAHPHDNHFYYFDISLAEVIRRHSMRSKSTEFSSDYVAELYKKTSPLEHMQERRIDDHMLIEQIIDMIAAETGILSL